MAELKENIARVYRPDQFYCRFNLPKRIGRDLTIESGDKKRVVETKLLFESPDVENVFISQGFDYIQDMAFAKSTVKKIEIESGLLGIDAMACADCTDLEEIILPNTLKYIGRETFQECYSLEDIILPPSVEAVGVDIFKKCANLRRICCGEKLVERISEWKRNAIGLTKVYIINDNYEVVGSYQVGAYSEKYSYDDKQFTKLEKSLDKKLSNMRKKYCASPSANANQERTL